jgi:hypothetical protein
MRTDQLAPTFSDTVFHGYCNAPYGQRGVGSDNLVDPVWFASRVVLGAVHLVAKPRDGLTVYIMEWRTTDYLAAVIGRIAHDNDFL